MDGVWEEGCRCFWIISGERACQWRRLGSARCILVDRVSGYILCGGGVGLNARRWNAKGRRRVVVGECGFLLARRRYHRKGRRRHHHRGQHDCGEDPILHLFAKLLVWVFVGLHSLPILALCLVRKIVGPG